MTQHNRSPATIQCGFAFNERSNLWAQRNTIKGLSSYNASMQPAHNAINLESYFDFLTPPDGRQAIRIAGTRVGIEFVLREYLRGASPEELALHFPTLTLEQIHATITYLSPLRTSWTVLSDQNISTVSQDIVDRFLKG